MSRDAIVEEIFLTADDAIQGLWGLHSYMKAAVETAQREAIKGRLPAGSFRLTHDWVRYYDPGGLIKEIEDVFLFVHPRNSLVGLVAIFEGVLLRLKEQPFAMSKNKHQKTYKKLLTWAFGIVRNSTSGSASMQSRLPGVCGHVDNGRLLRNCIAHNNGRYQQKYLTDAIDDNWVKIHHLVRNVDEEVAAKNKIVISNSDREGLFRSHIEFLHMLHNTIQRKVFNVQEDYNYGKEGKNIEWHRVFSGQPSVGM
jgi:hypothetical protein